MLRSLLRLLRTALSYCVRWWKSGEAYEYPVWMLLYDCKSVVYLWRWRGPVRTRDQTASEALGFLWVYDAMIRGWSRGQCILLDACSSTA